MAQRVADAVADEYAAYLAEPGRPPSRGGNTTALHRHVLTIAGESYGFLARGSRRWVYKSDRVSFDYEEAGKYRNIVKSTLKTVDRHGHEVVRGDRSFKTQLRTVPTRLPGSRRENND